MVQANPTAPARLQPMTQELLAESREYSREILIGLNASVSHFHAVEYCKNVLASNGFTELKESEAWGGLEWGKGYYFTRNHSTICAFLSGKNEAGAALHSYKIVGCHTDSPVLKIAPCSKLEKLGAHQINVMTYGGGLWRTWFDRDLSLAGKVIVKDGNKLVAKYWNAGRPLMKVPSLAIHLDR